MDTEDKEESEESNPKQKHKGKKKQSTEHVAMSATKILMQLMPGMQVECEYVQPIIVLIDSFTAVYIDGLIYKILINRKKYGYNEYKEV